MKQICKCGFIKKEHNLGPFKAMVDATGAYACKKFEAVESAKELGDRIKKDLEQLEQTKKGCGEYIEDVAQSCGFGGRYFHPNCKPKIMKEIIRDKEGKITEIKDYKPNHSPITTLTDKDTPEDKSSEKNARMNTSGTNSQQEMHDGVCGETCSTCDEPKTDTSSLSDKKGADMKLKTLKDLVTKDKDSIDYVISVEFAVKLKQETIKWVKKLDKDVEENKQVSIGEREYLSGLFSQIAWIKNFFNITEEDLK